jgi:hypothetical protein
MRRLSSFYGLRRYLSAGIVFIFLGSSQNDPSQNSPIVWVVASLQRVGPNDPAGHESQAQLWAGRGEYESFQIVTQAPKAGNLKNVNVSVSDLTGPGSQVISKDNVTLYREYYFHLDGRNGSPDWHGSNRPLGPGWYPDALIPFVKLRTGAPHSAGTAVPYNLSTGKNQPIRAGLLGGWC